MKKEEYTYADVIIDPNDERVKIGEKYYFGDNPAKFLGLVNKGEKDLEILSEIDCSHNFPFFTDQHKACCLIKPKEPQVKYVPFDLSKKEVRDKLRGKWIAKKEVKFAIEELIDRFTKDYQENFRCNGYLAKELLEKYTFLDGSPCGEEEALVNASQELVKD